MNGPPKPTAADYEAHARVEAYAAWVAHRIAVRRGRVTFVGDHEGAWVETEFGSEPMTDEVMEEMGWTIVRLQDGTVRYESGGL